MNTRTQAPPKTGATTAGPSPEGSPLAGALVPARASLIAKFGSKYNVEPEKLWKTLKATVFKGQKAKDGGPPREATDEELMALLIVADQYDLNPFTREIYAFPDEKRGGIVPVVSIDGWLRIINTHPELAGLEIAYVGFELKGDDPAFDGYIEVTITRKDRAKPIVVREYMNECVRDTGPWQSHPRRMLRHKAIIQAGRVAFGFGGIYDPDEAERIVAVVPEGEARVGGKPATSPPRAIAAEGTRTADPAPSSEPPGADATPITVQAQVQPARINDAQRVELERELDKRGVPARELCRHFRVDALEELPFASFSEAFNWIREVG